MKLKVVGPWLLLAGCDPIPPQSVDDITFPQGFQLDARAEVTVRMSSEHSDVVRPYPVVVRLPDGSPLYEGTVGQVMDDPPMFRLAPHLRQVEVIVQFEGVEAQTVNVDEQGIAAAVISPAAL